MSEPIDFVAIEGADDDGRKAYEKDERLKSRLCTIDNKSLAFAEDDDSDTEEEEGDGFAGDSEIPSQSTPEITRSSDEPEMVESNFLSTARASKKRKAMPPKEIHENHVSDKNVIRSRNTKHSSSGMTVCRTPSVNGLTIPFRTIKKAMKLDPDIPIVQNEAAIMTTVAVELFLKRLVVKSNQNAKNRGRNTVRYEDVAEARTADKALSFLEPLLP
jgi:histone H3/H4